MPLTAAATRTALAALPSQVEVVPVQLKFDGVTFNPDDLYKILSFLGIPRLVSPVPSRRSFQAHFNTDQQLLTNPGGEVDASGWSASAGGTLSRVTSGQLLGAGALQHSALAVAFEGIASAVTMLPVASRLQSPKVGAVIWLKALDGAESMTVQLEERSGVAGASSVAFTNQAVSLVQNVWQAVFVSRAFTAAGTGLRVAVVYGGGGGTSGHKVLADAVTAGFIETAQDAQLANATLNPDETARPTIVELDIALDQGQTLTPTDLYDVLDAQYATVATDKDSIGQQGNFSFTIS